MAKPTAVEDLDQSIRDAQEKFNVGMGADGDASPYPLLRELRAQSAGARRVARDGDDRQLGRRSTDVHRLHVRHREGDLHRQRHLQHPVLRRRRAATAGSDHPGDAGTRARDLPQAARIRVRALVDEAVGRRTRRSVGGPHHREVQGRQARRPRRRGVHADSGAGDRRAPGVARLRRRSGSTGSPSTCSAFVATWTARCGLRRR